MKVLALLCVLFGASYAATTVEILAGNGNFTTLVSLVKKANLVDTLNGANFTIFAPTNAAFAKVPAATMTALGNDVNALTNVLTYHVVSGRIPSSAAKNELKVNTVSGQEARFNIYKHNGAQVVTIEGAEITEFDKMASNGVIHVISDVMMAPKGDIVSMVAGNANYSTLLGLVQQAGIASALSMDNLTLFAPNNAAFAKVPNATVSKIIADVKMLTDILTYHVVSHTYYSKGMYDMQHLRSVDAHHDRLTIHTTGGVRIKNAHVVKADMSAQNGVVHEIDHVLIPNRYHSTVVVGK